LKKLGWKFVGPTNIYAFMQAMGLVNDHALECVVRAKVDQTYEEMFSGRHRPGK
jgi:DNA-3-methyladenine glycosylase I